MKYFEKIAISAEMVGKAINSRVNSLEGMPEQLKNIMTGKTKKQLYDMFQSAFTTSGYTGTQMNQITNTGKLKALSAKKENALSITDTISNVWSKNPSVAPRFLKSR